MLASQFIFITIILFIIYKTFTNYKKNHVSKQFITVWLLFWFFILFILIDQQLLSQIAYMLGIVRGVDLALYLSIIAIFYLIYLIYLKIQQLENKITKLIRNEALKKIQK